MWSCCASRRKEFFEDWRPVQPSPSSLVDSPDPPRQCCCQGGFVLHKECHPCDSHISPLPPPSPLASSPMLDSWMPGVCMVFLNAYFSAAACVQFGLLIHPDSPHPGLSSRTHCSALYDCFIKAPPGRQRSQAQPHLGVASQAPWPWGALPVVRSRSLSPHVDIRWPPFL